jgi:hypothetical protein
MKNLSQKQEEMKQAMKATGKSRGPYNLISKEELEDLYLNRHLTCEEIGRLYGRTRARISQFLKLYGIDTSKAEKFNITCPQCGKEFETYRKHFNSTGIRYCSAQCYHLHRSSISDYSPSRQGQRTARAVMASHLHRDLFDSEVVHHMDGNCDNNDIDNLVLFISQAEHLRFHHQMRILSQKKTTDSEVPQWCEKMKEQGVI